MTLRVAILCTGPDTLAPWMLRLAEGICRAPELELCGFLVSDSQAVSSRSGPLFKAWWAFESRLLAKPQAAETELFDQARATLKTGEANVDGVAVLKPDVVIDLTAGGDADAIASDVPLGVWSVDVSRESLGAGAMQAIVKKTPVTEVTLLRTPGGGKAKTLVSAAALNTKFVVTRNHLFMCEKAVALILRELKRAERGGLHLDQLAEAPQPRCTPGTLDLLVYLTKFTGGMMTRLVEKVATKVGLRPGMFFLKTSESAFADADPSAMRSHPTPANEYYADPFLWERDGETWCFFEVYDYTTGRGHLSAGRFEDGALADVRPVLKTDYHLSFPFLFEHDGDLFMMPETCGAHRIETWRCIEFPDRWEREATILDNVIAADSSLAQIGDDWWLFTNISNDPFGEMNSELHLYKVDGPGMKTLTPHALNPVVFDSRTARNGGRILERDGAYYRISQDNSHGRYGYGLNVMKIDHISLDDYQETIVRKIEPDFEPGVIGCHHMDARGDTVVMDVRRQVGGFTSARRSPARSRHG